MPDFPELFDCSCNFSSNRKDWGALIIVDDRFVYTLIERAPERRGWKGLLVILTVIVIFLLTGRTGELSS